MGNDKTPNYFLISVSTRENLELCIKYALAGFTNSINGLWTFLDIEEGDFVSFLYGARVRNLYRVVKKVAYKNADKIPPWPPITFKTSGKTYHFPFRFILKQERSLNEPMVRPEFSYVAENLLLRGGYRKTHFQADTVTFYNVSGMGEPYYSNNESLDIDAETFEPKIVFKKEKQKIPEKFYFRELILQSLVRKKLSNTVFEEILEHFKVNYNSSDFEILGEKALPEGYVDIFIKLKHPVGSNKYLLVEVKTGKTQRKDIDQLRDYMRELGNEVVGGVLIAKEFPKKVRQESQVLHVKYSFDNLDVESEYTYENLLKLLHLEVMV
ncbi:MAG: hypothetical protein H0Z19_03325 [Archaeoglobus sp.]|uniref:hypothetical protein n=1 Tax=Archaeoglobus sp. TaxID=1872626 RepID=UPI001DD0FDE2|nr:hypothetical protein [Archaeoglobus sp.]MBO8179498.1 hypothetical protein [Archaeoglobus sp.]